MNTAAIKLQKSINVPFVNTGSCFASYHYYYSPLKRYSMKKIFTLLFAVGMFTLAQAQPGSRDNRQTDQRDNQSISQRNQNNGFGDNKDVIDINFSFDNDSRFGNSRFSNERKRDMQIARINREYDYRIQSVRNNFFMSRWEKQRQISFLQEQRQREIKMVYAKFSNRNRYDDRYGRNDRRDQPYGH